MGRAFGPAASPAPLLATQRPIVVGTEPMLALADRLQTQLATRVAELLASDCVFKKSLT